MATISEDDILKVFQASKVDAVASSPDTVTSAIRKNATVGANFNSGNTSETYVSQNVNKVAAQTLNAEGANAARQQELLKAINDTQLSTTKLIQDLENQRSGVYQNVSESVKSGTENYKLEERWASEQATNKRIEANDYDLAKPSVLNFPMWLVNRIKKHEASRMADNLEQRAVILHNKTDDAYASAARVMQEYDASVIAPKAQLIKQQAQLVALKAQGTQAAITASNSALSSQENTAVKLRGVSAGESAGKRQLDLEDELIKEYQFLAHIPDTPENRKVAGLYVASLDKNSRDALAASAGARQALLKTPGSSGTSEELMKQQIPHMTYAHAIALTNMGITLSTDSTFLRQFQQIGDDYRSDIALSTFKNSPLYAKLKTLSTSDGAKSAFPAGWDADMRSITSVINTLSSHKQISDEEVATNNTLVNGIVSQEMGSVSIQEIAKNRVNAWQQLQSLHGDGQDISPALLNSPILLQTISERTNFPIEKLKKIMDATRGKVLAGAGNPSLGLFDKALEIREAVRETLKDSGQSEDVTDAIWAKIMTGIASTVATSKFASTSNASTLVDLLGADGVHLDNLIQAVVSAPADKYSNAGKMFRNLPESVVVNGKVNLNNEGAWLAIAQWYVKAQQSEDLVKQAKATYNGNPMLAPNLNQKDITVQTDESKLPKLPMGY